MKKIIFTLALLFVMSQMCMAKECDTSCCPAPYDLTSGFSRFVSTATGQNFIAEKVAESLVKKAIKKNIVSGKITAKLDSFSTRDLKAGKFKTLEITGKDVDIEGIYISYFNAKTLCDFNYIAKNGDNNYIVKEDIPIAFNTEITEEDLNKTMNSSDYKRLINDINSIGGSLNIFQIISTSVKLKNGKMYYIVRYAVPFVRKSMEVVISSDINVENGKIVLANTNFVRNNSLMDIDKFSSILNYINPLDFSAKILENKDANFSIKNVKITDQKINIDGIITVLKDKE